jgi:LPS sulfotransferase NodH
MMTTEQMRFVVFGQGRTGSHLLIELLRSHPDIACDDEVLNGYYWGRLARRLILPLWRCYPLPLFRHRAQKSQRAAYGFKLFDDHMRWPGLMLRHVCRDGWRIIHIQRRDLLAQAVSTAIARQTRRWHRRSGEASAPITLQIGAGDFLKIVAARETRAARINQFLADLPHLDIIYEDDLADRACWAQTSARLLSYLGLPIRELDTQMVKTWDRPYRELISNYDELAAALRRSRYRDLIERQPQCSQSEQ